uniref:SPOR domain-containing protein n=1 Tax=Ningiella ruwaisensis TaxID=2364274 RepID=UPI00109F752C|nr:SPOR domain-containing protein [Ningiella ruwaisensis]
MNSALQNRLVGTIIVMALVVILLPEVLDGEKRQSAQRFVDIPPAPEAILIEEPKAFPQEKLDEKTSRPVEIVKANPVDDPQSSDLTRNNLQNNSKSSSQRNSQDNNTANDGVSAGEPSDNETNQKETTKTLALEEPDDAEIEVQNSGYVVQLGSFRYEKNVNELISKLKQAGYRAYSRPVQTDVGILNKVFVGPELEREKLEQALPHLQELTNLKGKITAFEVSAG